MKRAKKIQGSFDVRVRLWIYNWYIEIKRI